MDNILLVKMSSLGDVVHNLPVATDIGRFRPQARIHWVVEEQYGPLVALHPGVHRVVPVALRRWRRAPFAPGTWREVAAFRRAVHAASYDAVIDTQGLIKSAWVCTLARGRRFGFGPRTVREPLAARVYDDCTDYPPTMHKVVQYRALAGHALGYVPPVALDYGIRPPQDPPPVAPRPYCVVFHSTARESKLWSEAAWTDVCEALAARGLSIVFPWGSERERGRSVRLAGTVAGARVAPRLAIPELAALIAGAELVVGVDTGLMHLAAALSVPVVGVYVASNPGFTAPIADSPHAFRGAMSAPPSVASVLEAVREVAPAWAP
jgi:heptosyltransferase-1